MMRMIILLRRLKLMCNDTKHHYSLHFGCATAGNGREQSAALCLVLIKKRSDNFFAKASRICAVCG